MKLLEDNIKLFTVGPAQMYQHTLDVRKHIVPYFRTSEFSQLMQDNRQLLIKMQGAKEDSEIIFLTASGSGAMEATVINCFNKEDKLLVISGGTFGERFEYICRIHNIPFVALKLGSDEELTSEHLKKYDDKGFTGLLINLHETYTGQLYDINIVYEFCKKNNLYLIVDAISTFMCDEYNMSQYEIDATIISSQKGLCLAPGLSMVTLSRRIIEEKIMKNTVQTMYFDFRDYLINIKRGQTPFTPCVGILYELNDMLNYVEKQGIKNRIEEVKNRCIYFRNRITEMPIHLPSFPLSNAITPIRFEKDIAKDFFEYLKNEKGMVVNPVGGELGKRSIRVAHIGDLSYQDYDELIYEIKKYFEI